MPIFLYPKIAAVNATAHTKKFNNNAKYVNIVYNLTF